MGRSGQTSGRKGRAPSRRRTPQRWEIEQEQAYVEHDPQLRLRVRERLHALDAPRLAEDASLDLALVLALETEGLPAEQAASWDARRGGKRWDRYPDRTPQRNEHVPVEVRYGEWSITLDEGIASLVEACWRNGFDTVMSCEENFGGRAWIQFASLSHAYNFISRIDGEEAANAYLQETVAALTPGPQPPFEPELTWWPAFDLTRQEAGWVVRASVRFPAERIPDLCAKLLSAPTAA